MISLGGIGNLFQVESNFTGSSDLQVEIGCRDGAVFEDEQGRNLHLQRLAERF